MVSEKDLQELLALKPDDISKTLFINYFAYTKKGNPRFKPNDKMVIPKGYMNLKEDTTTTVGRFIFNKFIIEKHFIKHVGYKNKTFTAGDVEDLEQELSELLLDEKITPDMYIEYLNKIQWLGFTNCDFMTPSMSYSTTVPLPKVMKRKQELLKEYKDDIENGNAAIAGAKIEAELLDLAKEELKDDPAMDLYRSGSRGKFGNHYKNFSIMRGPVKDNSTGRFRLAESNYVEGIKKEEYSMFGDMIVEGAYNRAVGTRTGGYQTKRIFAAFQTVSLDKPGSNCGTTKTLSVRLDKGNYKLYLFRYIVEGGKLKLLTNDNIKSYIGKTVNLRSPQFCTSQNLCSKCGGELYYKLGITNIGLTASKIGGSMLNLCLKSSHDVTLKIDTFDYKKFME